MAHLKCDEGRRVMVLSSGNTVHREDGSRCRQQVSIAGKRVTDTDMIPDNAWRRDLLWAIFGRSMVETLFDLTVNQPST